MMFFPFLALRCFRSVEDMIAHQIVRLVSSNLNNIQIIKLCDFFSLSEISELTSSEGRSELKEKSETFRSLQKVTFKFKTAPYDVLLVGIQTEREENSLRSYRINCLYTHSPVVFSQKIQEKVIHINIE